MHKNIFRKLHVKWLVWRGMAVDIWSKNTYPANILSNLYSNSFSFDDVECGSMEGFLQSLKYKDTALQRLICSKNGKDAKESTTSEWQTYQVVWWKGKPINRQSDEFIQLIRSAYEALFCQNEEFHNALMSTKGKTLFHCRGEQDPEKTILTEQEFCQILTDIREANPPISMINGTAANTISEEDAASPNGITSNDEPNMVDTEEADENLSELGKLIKQMIINLHQQVIENVPAVGNFTDVYEKEENPDKSLRISHLMLKVSPTMPSPSSDKRFFDIIIFNAPSPYCCESNFGYGTTQQIIKKLTETGLTNKIEEKIKRMERELEG